jgi:hypothetical protein
MPGRNCGRSSHWAGPIIGYAPMIVREWFDEDKGQVTIEQSGRSGPAQYKMENKTAVFVVYFRDPRWPSLSRTLYHGLSYVDAERAFDKKVMELES